ncbi:MAG: hypothetical protein E7511_03065 [Ruminococcus sp.]|nr:hypothetical protein [Ruminococcus sp.]
MMMYPDYDYYTEDYGGAIVPEEFWKRAAGSASDYLNAVTFGRLENGIPGKYGTKVARCLCEMAEQIWITSLSAAADASGEPAKASESNGAYSVTYRSASEGISAQLHGDTAGLEDLLLHICRKHLSRTGLLYRGV